MSIIIEPGEAEAMIAKAIEEKYGVKVAVEIYQHEGEINIVATPKEKKE